MTINTGDINLEKILIKINNLKDEFTIIPDINSLSDIELLLGKEIRVKHIRCGNEQTIVLSEWLQSKYDSITQNENYKFTHFCKKCVNELKKKSIQEYIDTHYNGEFVITGEYTGFKDKIELKHIGCGEKFTKTPSYIKSKSRRLFCKHCGKSDSLYEKEMIDKRNQELKDRFKKENISTYIPLEDNPGMTKKMKFEHLTCGNEFESSAYDVYKHYSKKDHCPKCFKNKTKSSTKENCQESKDLAKMRNRHRRFLKFAKEFTFIPDINSFDTFKENHEKEFIIIHKSCGRSVTSNLANWSKQRGYTLGRASLDNYLYLCPHCYEEFKRNELQEFLNKTYNKEFLIVGKFNGIKKPISIKHIECGEVFTAIPDAIRHKGLTCKGCGKSDKKKENKLQKDKNKELIKKFKKEGLSEFEPLEDNHGISKIMKIKHARCGHTIEVTPQSLLRLKNKNYCPKCPEKLLSKEVDLEKRTEYAQEAINIINNNKFNIVGLYDDDEDILNLFHKDCLREFPISKRNLFYKEINCPHCETDNFKNNRYISIKDKIKLYEEILNNEYKILKAFTGDEDTVPIKHVECGHVFERTISIFLRSKDKLFCPKCRREKKLAELNKKLFDKYKGEFEVCNLEEYSNARTTLDFIHKDCGTVFPSNFDKIIKFKNSPCPKCNPQITTLEKLKNEVYTKHKGEYLVIGDFKGNTKKTSFRHKKCEKIFYKTPYNFFNSDIPCPHCYKEESMLGLKEAQKRVRQNSGKLFTLNGIYRGIKKEIPVTCNSCKQTFMSTPKKMFNKKSCPKCNAKEIKKE